MKKYLFAAAMLLCAGGLSARIPGAEVVPGPRTGREKQSSASKQAAVPAYAAPSQSTRGRIVVAQVPAAPDAAKKYQSSASAAKKEAAKAAEQDSEEAGVMIDSKSEDTESDASPSSSMTGTERQEDVTFASYIPSSYGQMKGVLNEQGRSVLIFENEEGILSFVQVSVGKKSVAWKLLARVARSQE
ncbi:MAG: hypothetical protein NTX59_03600 [Elusimicrobia bacterium]|nr:hypothetical protein [Elusimicrobiota bacterium]